jgi:hypothetical protein
MQICYHPLVEHTWISVNHRSMLRELCLFDFDVATRNTAQYYSCKRENKLVSKYKVGITQDLFETELPCSFNVRIYG